MSCLFHNSCKRSHELDYLKGPVRFLHELYARYPDGGHEGDVALVTRARGDEAGWAYWHVASRTWRLMSGGGGDYIDVSPGELEFPADGGEFILTIESNTNYTIMADNWLSLGSSSGTGSGSVSVTAGANAEGARSGSVVFTSSGGDVKTVTVLQAAKQLVLSYAAVSPAGSGTNTSTSTAGSYDYGSTISLNASALAHYGFALWEKQVSSSWVQFATTAAYSFAMTESLTLRPVFARTEYQVTTAVDDPAKGSVSAGGWVAAGGSIELTATATTGNVFVEWNDGNTQNPRTVMNIQADVTFTALFDAGSLEVSPTSLSFTAEGETKAVGVVSDISWTAAVNYD